MTGRGQGSRLDCLPPSSDSIHRTQSYRRVQGWVCRLLAPLSQLEEKSEWDQGVWCRGLHYMALVGARVSFPGAVIRGGGCGGRSRLSCLSKSFWSALSSV